LLVASAVVLGSPCGTTAQEAHPLTFEDSLRVKDIPGFEVSPDGRKIALVTVERSLEANKSFARVWVLDLADGKMVHVTAGGTSESSPAWSPDGSRLAFVSNKGDSPQLWVARAGSGEAPVQVTALSTGASDPLWAPAGDSIFFLSEAFPDCTSDKCNKSKLDDLDTNPVKAKLFDRLMYRHWDQWRNGAVAHLHVVPASGGSATDLMPGDEWGVTGAWDVTPDGNWLLFTTKDPLNETLSTNNEIARVAARCMDPPQVRQILTANPAFDGTPKVSPGGHRVAWQAQRRPGFESDRLYLEIADYDDESGWSPFTVGAKIDRWVVEHGWFPDSDSLYFVVFHEGRMRVYSTPADEDASPTLLIDGPDLHNVRVSPDGKYLFSVSQTLSSPPEVWRYDADGKNAVQVSHVNDSALAGVALARVEDFWWDGADGDRVHGFLLFPPGTSRDSKNPFLLLIHGGPQGMWTRQMHPRWNAQLLAAPGYVTLLANPRGSVGYGQEFTDQISGDWGGRVFEDLMKGVDAAIEAGFADPERMCAAGGSFGGYMANWILGHSDRFKCLISHAGVYDLRSKYGSTDELWFPEWEFGGTPWSSSLYETLSPSSFVEQFKTPTLVIHGAHDYRVPENQAMQLFTALQRRGVPSEFLYFPDETHFVVKPRNSKLWYDTFHGWLKRWIGP